MTKTIQLKEVGPRDGLQNERFIVPTAQKVAFIDALSLSGLSYIEVSSFVSPKWMPQLADADEVFQAITRQEGVTYAALVPNEKGLERALRANVDEVNIFISASEGHNLTNIRQSIAESLATYERVIQQAKAAQKTVRAYISMVIACPYDGKTDPARVRDLAEKLFQMGADEVSLGDTIGVGTPLQVRHLLEECKKTLPVDKLAMHFHDTYGMAIANIVESLAHGITIFDSAAGGLGGCPYAKGASGNVATEDVLYLLDQLELPTNVHLPRVLQACQLLEQAVQKPLSSKQMAIYRGE